MTRRARSCTSLLVAVLLLGSCGPGVTSGPRQVRLSGAIQKGPFIIGSTVTASALDAAGNPTGDVFNTQTANDLGEYDATFQHQGLLSLDVTGFYFNEVWGLSQAPLTLRALHLVEGSGQQVAFINLVTHLSYDRELVLIREGKSYPEAVAQAEAELRAGLGVVPADFEPGATGLQMNLFEGDTPASRYLLAVSAVVSWAAGGQASGRFDAELQQLINRLAADLASDGTLEPALRAQLAEAALSLDISGVHRRLAERMAELGVIAPPPNITPLLVPCGAPGHGCAVQVSVYPTDSLVSAVAVLDADGDQARDVVALSDGGLQIFHNDGEGTLTAGATLLPGGEELALGDFNGDGRIDVVVAGEMLRTYLASDEGLAEAASTGCAVEQAVPGCGGKLAAGDITGDGKPDLLLTLPLPPNELTRINSYVSSVAVGKGDGSFHAPVRIAPEYGRNMALGDFNNDGRQDVVGYRNISLSQGELTFSQQPAVDLSSSIRNGVLHAQAVDLNGDGKLDLLTSGGVYVNFPGSGNLAVSLGNGDGTLQPPLGVGWQGPVLQVLDFNQDGRDDIAVSQTEEPTPGQYEGYLQYLTGRASGELLPAFRVSVAPVKAPSVTGVVHLPSTTGELNGDGVPDLVYWNWTPQGPMPGQLTVLLSTAGH